MNGSCFFNSFTVVFWTQTWQVTISLLKMWDVYSMWGRVVSGWVMHHAACYPRDLRHKRSATTCGTGCQKSRGKSCVCGLLEQGICAASAVSKQSVSQVKSFFCKTRTSLSLQAACGGAPLEKLSTPVSAVAELITGHLKAGVDYWQLFKGQPAATGNLVGIPPQCLLGTGAVG